MPLQISRTPNPLFLRVERDFAETPFLHDGYGFLATPEQAKAFIEAAQNNLKLNARQIQEFNEQLLVERGDDKTAAEGAEISKVVLRRTYIYVMKNHRNLYCKIGHSRTPEFRERTLQSQEPEVTLLLAQLSYSAIEQALHAHFAPKRIRGEWFNLTVDDVKAIPALIAEMEAKL